MMIAGNIVRIIDDRFFDLADRSPFVVHDFFQMNAVERKCNGRIQYPRPFEFWKIVRFRRIGIGQR